MSPPSWRENFLSGKETTRRNSSALSRVARRRQTENSPSGRWNELISGYLVQFWLRYRTADILAETLVPHPAKTYSISQAWMLYCIPAGLATSYFLNISGANRDGSTSINFARPNLSFSLKGTVQSKIVLQEIPRSRILGLNSGDCEGSSGWQRTPGIKMVSTSP